MEKKSVLNTHKKLEGTEDKIETSGEGLVQHETKSGVDEIKQSIDGANDDAKNIQEIRDSLGVNKEQQEFPETKIFEVLGKAQSLFEDEKEFGEEGKKGAEKIKEITEKIQKFLNSFKQDYIKEFKKNGITPNKFMDEFGIGSLSKEGSGWSAINIEEYDFDNIKKGWESPKGKTIGGDPRYGESFSDFSVPIYKKYDWAKDSRTVPFLGEWKKQEIHEDWFTPKQEEVIYKLLTGNQGFDIKNRKLNSQYEFTTVIPGVTLNLGGEYSCMDTKGKGKPIHNNLISRLYGWRKRESTLKLTPKFIKAYLESAQQ